MDKMYKIIYTESAVQDMEEKADYISLVLYDPGLAETWHLRLRAEILKDLAHFPYKYPSIICKGGVLKELASLRFEIM